MQRVLALVLTMAFATGLAAPAAACLIDDTVATYAGHGCCGQPMVGAAPAGPCCVVSQPQPNGLTESRTADARHDTVARLVAGHLGRPENPGNLSRARATSSPDTPGVPIYLAQLSLLI